MDLVPNHTSSAHPWFQAALASSPGSDQRERYIFRDGTGPGGIHPPNNWVSIFGGPAWTRVVEADGNPGQWYLHLFDAEQPDLNWDNPEVFDDLEKTLRFWLERGIDGFRIDVAHGMAKPPGLPDMEVIKAEVLLADMDDDPRFNNDGVHDIHRQIRTVFNDYPHAVAIGEVWVYDNEQFARYVRPDELHLGFNFRLLRADVRRRPTSAGRSRTPWPPPRLGGRDADMDAGQPRRRPRADPLRRRARRPGPRAGDGAGDAGAARRGVPLQRRGTRPAERRAARRGAARPGVGTVRAHRRGRDACRVPMPWAGDAPPFDFSANPDTWLPIPPEWAALTVEKQLDDPESTLSFFRRAIELRRSRAEFDGATDRMAGLARRRSGVPAAAADWCVHSTRVDARCRCPPARCCWPAPSWSTASCHRTPAWLSGSRERAKLPALVPSRHARSERVSAAPARGRRGGGTPSRSARRCAARPAAPAPARSRRRRPSPGSSSPPRCDCGRKPIAVKANTHRIGMPTLVVARADRHHLLIQQRRRRAVRAGVLLGQRDSALRQVEHGAGGHVVEVDEAGVGRQGAAPRGVHREAGLDVAVAVHRRAARPPARRHPRTGRRAGPGRPPPGWPARRNPLPPRRRPGRPRAPAAGSPRPRRAAAPVR